MAELTADPPFARGQTLGVDATQGGNYIGVTRQFLDANPTTGVKLSNLIVRCVAVRNTSGAAILPKTVVKFAATDLLNSVDGSADNTSGLLLGIADEYLPAAGVAANDIFWVVFRGPTTVKKTTAAISQAAAVGPSTTAGSAVAGSGIGNALDTAALGTTEVRVLAQLTHRL